MKSLKKDMKLKDLASLNDSACNQFYAEMAGVDFKPAWDVQWKVPNNHGGLDPRSAPMFESPHVCRPDCPASILEGLPGLVEKWTGRAMSMLIHYNQNGRFVYMYREQLTHDSGPRQGQLHQFAGNNSGRHLAHACIVAALAACVVYGRKEA